MSGLGESILEEGQEGTSPERIAGKLMKRFSLTEEEAATYVEQYGSKKE